MHAEYAHLNVEHKSHFSNHNITLRCSNAGAYDNWLANELRACKSSIQMVIRLTMIVSWF
jgi:hypothetical protein